MLVTWDVLKFDKSNEINDEQSRNIWYINVIWDVLKFDKFNDINNEQPPNI